MGASPHPGFVERVKMEENKGQYEIIKSRNMKNIVQS
jgi:hypothetical protein